MGVYKRGNIWYIDYYEPMGKRVRKAVGPSRKLAETVLAKYRVQIAEDKFLDKNRRKRISFGEAAEIFLDRSLSSRDFTTFKHLVPWFSGKCLTEITPLDIENYKITRARKVRETTVNRELNSLKSFYNKMINWELADINPTNKVRCFPEKKFARLRYLNEGEIQRLLDECRLPHLRMAVLTALNTGMRKGEILSLRWADIDLENRYIHVEKTKTLKRRDIYINDLLFSALKSWRTHPDTDPEVLFPVKTIRRIYTEAVKRAGIADFRFHDLRHTFASHLVMKGVDLATVSELLGHSSIEMTMRYTHLSREHKMEAVKKLLGLFQK